jgi:hypothetical protein
VAVGTDETAQQQLDILYNDGSAWEYRYGTNTWSPLWLDTSSDTVTSLGKARLGLADVVFASEFAYEHTNGGFTVVLDSGTAVAAV